MSGDGAASVAEQLRDERDRLLRLMEDLAAGAPAGSWTGTLGHTGDLVDAASFRSARDDAETLVAVTRQRLARIEDALRRIDEGAYGTCEVCGREIDPERLEVLPFTTVCVDDVRSARTA